MLSRHVFVFRCAFTTDRCNAFQHISGNQKKSELYDTNFQTMLFLVTTLTPKWNFTEAKSQTDLSSLQVSCKRALRKANNLVVKVNKRNDKRFNNRGYSLFFLMGIYLNHLLLIPNILKWLDCKIFTELVPSQTLLRSKGVFKN